MLRVISFFQEGCMACEEQDPINREVEEALGIQFESINPLQERSYIDTYHLQVTPTVLLIKDDRVVERFEGVVHQEQLEEAIRKHVS